MPSSEEVACKSTSPNHTVSPCALIAARARVSVVSKSWALVKVTMPSSLSALVGTVRNRCAGKSWSNWFIALSKRSASSGATTLWRAAMLIQRL